MDLLNLVLPKKKNKKGGTADTGTFNPQNANQILAAPQYQEHLTDIFTTRIAQDSRELLKDLFRQDPDVSAAVNAYLTIANTEPIFVVRDINGEIDRESHKILNQIIVGLTYQTDYTLGFILKQSLRSIAENLRYMVLLRGGCSTELVLNEQLVPSEVRHIDLQSVQWEERKSGQYKPFQVISGEPQPRKLDIPSFFVSYLHRDPTEIYPYSSFVSCINTIAARQTVINELYRIMQVTGFPRIDLEIVEEVLTKTAPADVRSDGNKMRTYIAARMTEVANTFASIRSDQPFVHTDSVKAGMINEKNPAVGIPIEQIINVLNSQNQAALKTMATIIGRGESGVNTASVEARVFSMNADELNGPVAEILSRMFTFALHLLGRPSFVECKFRPSEMRPDLELEPQMVMRQSRLQTDLSLGLITDEEYHIAMLGRIAPESAPELSGTNFMQAQGASVDAEGVSPNSDPLGRSIASPDSQTARSKTVKRK